MKSDEGDVSLCSDRRDGGRSLLLLLLRSGRRVAAHWAPEPRHRVPPPGSGSGGWAPAPRPALRQGDSAGEGYADLRVVLEEEAVELWWSELPRGERNLALSLPEGAPLPEEFTVGLVLSGFTFPTRPPGSTGVEQPAAFRQLLGRENSWRRRSGIVDVQGPGSSPGGQVGPSFDAVGEADPDPGP